MKELYNGTVAFITPTFLAGANQNRPEIRPPSIRGALRWWFRILGGNSDLETYLFGGVGGTPTASQIVVRVTDIEPKSGQLPKFNPMSDFGYIYFFAQKSGNDMGIHRTEPEHFWQPETSFRLIISLRETAKNTDDSSINLLSDSILAFLRLGALGLRSTRGCGAMAEATIQSKDEFVSWVETLPKNLKVRLISKDIFADWKTCQEKLGGFLRSLRTDNKVSGKIPSALGFSSGKERESSALHLRPVKINDGFLPVIIYTDAACSQKSLAQLVLNNTVPLK